MSKGIRRLPDKEKRKARRFNHIAKDLHHGSKYRQRVVPNERKPFFDDDDYEEDWD